jgi:hypothetical protein
MPERRISRGRAGRLRANVADTMPMFPEVHITLDRPTINHIYQLFLPFVPGGTLVIGLRLTNPRFSGIVATAGLGRYSRAAVVVFAAYATGLMLYALSVHFAALLSTVAVSLVFKNQRTRPSRDNALISKNPVWRTVAAAFLGDKLIPTVPSLEGSSLKTTALQFAAPVPPSVLQHDSDWNDWYNILQDYLLRGKYILTADALFVWTVIQATGWAFILLSLQPGQRRWAVFAVVGSVVLVSALLQFGASYTYWRYDRLTAADFTAQLVAEIRAREDAGRGGTPVPPNGGQQHD